MINYRFVLLKDVEDIVWECGPNKVGYDGYRNEGDCDPDADIGDFVEIVPGICF